MSQVAWLVAATYIQWARELVDHQGEGHEGHQGEGYWGLDHQQGHNFTFGSAAKEQRAKTSQTQSFNNLIGGCMVSNAMSV